MTITKTSKFIVILILTMKHIKIMSFIASLFGYNTQQNGAIQVLSSEEFKTQIKKKSTIN